MKSFSIIILAVVFLSSFNSTNNISPSNVQLVLADSCRVSKVYLDGKVKAVHIYDGNNNLVRSDSHRSYTDFKYDDLNRIIEMSMYQFFSSQDEYILTLKRHFAYSGDSNLIKEKGHYQCLFEDRTKQPVLHLIEEYTYNSNGLLVKSQIIDIKKKRRKTIRKPRAGWSEYKYRFDDRNNPILIESYTTSQKKQQILTWKRERQFDLYLNHNMIPQFNCLPLSINNVIKDKATYFNSSGEEDSWLGQEIETEYQYSDEGLILNKKTKSKGKTHLTEYEYICD